MPIIHTYDKTTKQFHWASAVLILLMWLIGQAFDYIPEGDPSDLAMSVHISTGLLLGVVVFLRLVWRFTKGTKLPNANTGTLGTLAKAAHHTLYLLLICVLVAGTFAVWVHGISIFYSIHIPEFDPGNEGLKDLIGDVHGTLANLLFGLSALHGALALWHHFIKKDGILKRMT